MKLDQLMVVLNNKVQQKTGKNHTPHPSNKLCTPSNEWKKLGTSSLIPRCLFCLYKHVRQNCLQSNKPDTIRINHVHKMDLKLQLPHHYPVKLPGTVARFWPFIQRCYKTLQNQKLLKIISLVSFEVAATDDTKVEFRDMLK